MIERQISDTPAPAATLPAIVAIFVLLLLLLSNSRKISPGSENPRFRRLLSKSGVFPYFIVSAILFVLLGFWAGRAAKPELPFPDRIIPFLERPL
ncbi:MAG: hypothetical protein AAGU11_19605, partial [Syntrophobacteraceae bacterium]